MNRILEEMTKQLEAKADEKGLIGRDKERYVSSMLLAWQKEENKKAIEEGKLLATAMEKFLPEIYEGKRAIPNYFLRGALFGMVEKKERIILQKIPVVSTSQYEITYTGYPLDQNDLEIWDTLMYLAKQHKIQDYLSITLYEFLKILKMSDNGTNRKAVVDRVKRLQLGQITIKKGRSQYFGSLIDAGYIDENGTGNLIVQYNKKLAPSFANEGEFKNDYTIIDTEIRDKLGDNQLARWLFHFYATHDDPIIYPIQIIKQLCKSEIKELRLFKFQLKKSLELVKNAYKTSRYPKKWDYCITSDDKLKIIVPSKFKNKKHQEYDAHNSEQINYSKPRQLQLNYLAAQHTAHRDPEAL